MSCLEQSLSRPELWGISDGSCLEQSLSRPELWGISEMFRAKFVQARVVGDQ